MRREDKEAKANTRAAGAAFHPETWLDVKPAEATGGSIRWARFSLPAPCLGWAPDGA